MAEELYSCGAKERDGGGGQGFWSRDGCGSRA